MGCSTLTASSFRVSVQFGCSVMSNSLQHHEPQQARPPCPSPTPRVHPNPCPLSRWGHPTILSSVTPLSSCPQSFPDSAFSNESALCIRWPKYWSFSFNISPSNKHPGLISFRIIILTTLYQIEFLDPIFTHKKTEAKKFKLLYGESHMGVHGRFWIPTLVVWPKGL